MTGSYVYAVVGSDESTPLPADTDLRLVPHGPVAAVVGPADDLAEGANVETVKAHADVVERVNATRTTLPVQLGLVLEDDQQVVERVLEPHAERLGQLLKELADRVELRVRARYDKDALLRHVAKHDASIARLNDRVKRLPEGSGHAQRIELGELIAAGMERQQEADAAHLLAALVPHAVRHRTQPAPAELLALNAAFLVDADGIGAFDAAARAATQELGDRLSTTVIGPVPPWDFVELEEGGS